MLTPLPTTFTTTREALRQLACYVLAPTRKARTGRIGLRPTTGGFGTTTFEDGTQLAVRGAELVWRPAGTAVPITTLAAAAEVAGIELVPDPGVGHDLPPFEPDARLAVDEAASLALGGWYALGQAVLDGLREELAPTGGTASEVNLWPEHFDLAMDWGLDAADRVNIGASPGDAFAAEPYLYVGPWDRTRMRDERFWNAPFGATLPHRDLLAAADAHALALGFVRDALRQLDLVP